MVDEKIVRIIVKREQEKKQIRIWEIFLLMTIFFSIPIFLSGFEKWSFNICFINLFFTVLGYIPYWRFRQSHQSHDKKTITFSLFLRGIIFIGLAIATLLIGIIFAREIYPIYVVINVSICVPLACILLYIMFNNIILANMLNNSYVVTSKSILMVISVPFIVMTMLICIVLIIVGQTVNLTVPLIALLFLFPFYLGYLGILHWKIALMVFNVFYHS